MSEVRAGGLPHRCCLQRRADEPSIPAARASAARARDQRSRGSRIAGGAKIGIVERGEHGDAEEARPVLAAAFDGRPHGCRIGMDGGQRHAEPGDAADCAFHRVVDVEKLHVEKDTLVGRDQARDERQAAGEDELHADLVEASTASPSAETIASAEATSGTSSATIIRSRGSRGCSEGRRISEPAAARLRPRSGRRPSGG